MRYIFKFGAIFAVSCLIILAIGSDVSLIDRLEIAAIALIFAYVSYMDER